MLTKPQDKPPTDQDKQGRQELNAVIGQHVILALGKPGGLLMVQVRPLWEDRYRANVFVGVDVTSAKVAHSYFLVVNSDGNILASTPKITKQYGPAAGGDPVRIVQTQEPGSKLLMKPSP